MKALVAKASEILFEMGTCLSLGAALLSQPGIPEVCMPEIAKECNHRQGQHAIKQNQHGIVAGVSLVDLQRFVPYLDLRGRTQSRKFYEIGKGEGAEEDHKEYFAQQI